MEVVDHLTEEEGRLMVGLQDQGTSEEELLPQEDPEGLEDLEDPEDPEDPEDLEDPEGAGYRRRTASGTPSSSCPWQWCPK